MKERESKINSKIELGLIFCIIGIFALIIIANIYSIDTHVNSEVAFEIVFAKQVQEEKSLFPGNFYYGYELSALRPAAVAALINTVIDNMLLSYAVSMIATAMIILVSIYYLMKQLNLSKTAILFGILAYFGLSSYENMYVSYLYNGYFGYYIAAICVIIGYYLKCFRNEKINVSFFALGGVTFIFGLMGVRMLETLYLPLLVFDIIYNGYKLYYHEKINFNTIKYSGYLFLCNIAGFVCFSGILSKKYIIGAIPSNANFLVLDRILDEFKIVIVALLKMLNLYGGSKILSKSGILYLLFIMVVLIVCLGTYKIIVKEKENIDRAVVVSIFLASIVMTVIVLSLTDWKIMERYFFTAPILVGIVLAILCDYLHGKNWLFMCLLLSVIVLTAAGNLYQIYKPMIVKGQQKPEEELQIIQYLEEKKVNNGFGILCGLPIGPISNFNVKLSYLWYDEINNEFLVTTNMSSGDSYSPKLTDKRSFLMVTNSGKEQYYEKWKNTELFQNPYIEQEFNNYTIYIFDFNILIDERME